MINKIDKVEKLLQAKKDLEHKIKAIDSLDNESDGVYYSWQISAMLQSFRTTSDERIVFEYVEQEVIKDILRQIGNNYRADLKEIEKELDTMVCEGKEPSFFNQIFK